MAASRHEHWQAVYTQKQTNRVSWFERFPGQSIAFIRHTGIKADDAIIDVGAGASTLVDTLLEDGFQDVSCLDLSEKALLTSQKRLQNRRDEVTWLHQDIRYFHSEKSYALWHDRAVFHFLTRASDREKYIDALNRHLQPQGHLIMATFSPDGPQTCSGLEIVQYDADSLLSTLGKGFHLVEDKTHIHRTPAGGEQEFIYCYFIKD